jgi:hypothetical protein
MALYCETCRKEIVVIGVGPGAAPADEMENVRRSIEKEGKLVLFNPPPFGPRFCPECHAQIYPLEEEEK